MTSEVMTNVEVTSGSLVLVAVAHGFDVVAVRVANERAVVGGVVLRPDARLVQCVGALPQGDREELAHCGPVRRPEGQVALAEAVSRRPCPQPERRVVGAVAQSTVVLGDAAIA